MRLKIVLVLILTTMMFSASSAEIVVPLTLENSPTEEQTEQASSISEKSSFDKAPYAVNHLVEQWMNVSGEYNDRLLATVYWMLGTVGTVFLALIGYNWFTNFKIYERDKEALSAELKGEINQNSSEMYKQMRELFDKKLAELEISLTSKAEKRIQSLDSRLDALQHKNAEIKFHFDWKINELESQRWVDRGVHINAISCELEIWKAAINYDYDWLVSRTLNRIESFLPHVGISDLDEEFFDLLQKLPEKYSILKQRISEKLSRMQ